MTGTLLKPKGRTCFDLLLETSLCLLSMWLKQISHSYIDISFSMSFLKMAGPIHTPKGRTCLDFFLKLSQTLFNMAGARNMLHYRNSLHIF